MAVTVLIPIPDTTSQQKLYRTTGPTSLRLAEKPTLQKAKIGDTVWAVAVLPVKTTGSGNRTLPTPQVHG